MWGHACIRLMRVLAVVLVSAGLTGCVAYTGGYDYGGGYYSAGGYYAAPVVAPPPAVVYGGGWRGYGPRGYRPYHHHHGGWRRW